MKRVAGIGGIFFRARDAVALREWYRKHLGIDVQDRTDESEFGKFGWAMDPEGNKVGFRQPPSGQ